MIPDVIAFKEALVVVIRVLGVEVDREVSDWVVIALAVLSSVVVIPIVLVISVLVVKSIEVSVVEVVLDIVLSFWVEDVSEVVVLSVEEEPADVVAVESLQTKYLWIVLLLVCF
jgi:hypothetical protein